MEEEISLRELIETLLKGKWIIIVITLTAVLISGAVSFFILEPTYEAKTVIAVKQTNSPKTQSSALRGLVDTTFRVQEMNIQSYITQVKTAAVLKKIMENLQIDPQEISLSTFSNNINIKKIKDTDLLEVTVQDKDAQRAANIANALAEELVELASVTNKESATENMELLEKQINEEQTKLVAHVAEMKLFLQKPDSVAELETELDTALQLLSSFQGRKVELQVEKKKVSTMIEAIEQQLIAVPTKIELDKNLFDKSSLTGSLSSSDSLALKSEELNPVYVELKKELELNKAMLTQLYAEEASIQEEILKIGKTIKTLQVKLADKKISLEQLQLNLDTAKENYILLYNKRVETQFAEAIEEGKLSLEIVSPANQPPAPVGPRKMLNLAVAACLGLMLGVFVVLFRAYWLKTASCNV